MNGKRCLRVLAAAGLCAVLCGCATPVYQAYEGPVRGPEEVAVVEPAPGPIPLLCKIDGKPGPKRFHVGFGRYLPRYNSMNGGKFRVELLPGEHMLECSVMSGGWSPSTTLVKFNAEAGKKYELAIKTKSRGLFKSRKWWAEVAEAR